MEDSGYLTRARQLTPASASIPVDLVRGGLLLLEIADSLPTRGPGRQVSDDVELARMQAANRNRQAWTDALRLHADEDALSASLWLSYNCAYVGAGQHTLGEWLAVVPTWRETPLLAFTSAICGIYTRSSFDSLLEAEPRFKELHYYIGLSLGFAGKIDDSLEHLLLAYAWHPRWPAVTNALAADYIALEEFDKAIEFYDHTLEVVPAFPDALLGKAKAQTYAGNYTEAIATLDRLLALERWLVGDARYWRAFNELQLGRLDIAWDDVEAAAKLMRNAEVPKLAGIIAYRRQQLDTARVKFDESWKVGRGEDCETGFYLGIVLAEQARWPRTSEVLVATVACLEKMEQKLTAEIASIRASTDRPERQERQARPREQDIPKRRRMKATRGSTPPGRT